MMMQMLDAGGVPIMTDQIRRADDDNPKGYYEYERVKDLDKPGDTSWVRECRGQAIKVISFLLKDLPNDNQYQVVFLERNLDEVLASQAKMLQHRDEANESPDDRMRENYKNHLFRVRAMLKHSPHMEALFLPYHSVVGDPVESARMVNRFLGGWLDEAAMSARVDAGLYRNRAQK